MNIMFLMIKNSTFGTTVMTRAMCLPKVYTIKCILAACVNLLFILYLDLDQL